MIKNELNNQVFSSALSLLASSKLSSLPLVEGP
jgi:hypothetical protein